MAQITLYVPDEVADRIKREAKKAHKSVSAYVTELASKQISRRAWPARFTSLYGSWKGDFPTPEDAPPADVDGFR